MSDYDSEDDKPLVFKRNNATLKQNQSNPELTKSLSQKLDAISGKQVSDVRLNGQNSSQVDKTVSLLEGSPFASKKVSSSSAEAESQKSPVTNIKAPTSAADHSNIIIHNASDIVMEKTLKEENQSRSDSEDSDDDKPLSHKLLSEALNGNSHYIRMECNPSRPKPKISKDPEDEMVLSMKFAPKLNAGTSTGKSSDSDESKPLALEPKKEPLSSLNKRPLIQTKNSNPSSSKKAKLSEGSASMSRKRKQPKAEEAHDDDDDLPISQRTKKSAIPVSKVSDKKKITDVSASLDKVNKKSKKVIKKTKFSKSLKVPPGSGEGQKWTTLVHNGVIFPPLYKPHGVKMLYKGNPVDLTPEQEEVATMFAVMLDTEYMAKPKFKENFMSDWKKILGNKHIIQNLEDCDFTPIYEWHQREKEKKKQMSTDEKKAIKEEKMKQEEKYMWAIVDGVKEKVGNFRVEPPGLFRGRGEHPKMGKLKKRIFPKDITINIGKDAPIPEPPISGER